VNLVAKEVSKATEALKETTTADDGKAKRREIAFNVVVIISRRIVLS